MSLLWFTCFIKVRYYHTLYHPEAVVDDEEHGFVSHLLLLSLLSFSEEKNLVEQAQKPVALTPIHVDFEMDTHCI